MTMRNILILYFGATFLQAGTYGLTFLLPPLFESFGANEKDVGIVLLLTTISTLLSVLYLGHLTVAIGRVNTIGLAAAILGMSLFLFGQADNFGPMLFIAGGLLGIGWGLFYVLTPVILTEITPKQDRIRIFMLLSVFIMAGFGLSPVFGAYLVKAGYGVDLAFSLTAMFCLISGCIFLVLRKPIAAHSLDQSPSANSGLSGGALSWAVVQKVLRSPARRPIIMIGMGAAVFAAVTNFQTVFAEQNGLDYTIYFLAYTMTVIACRVLFAQFIGGRSPYGIIAILLGVMAVSVLSLILFKDRELLYILGAVLFGIGYGVSYPIIKAMAANDADPAYLEQTLQIFGFSYFIGVFGFPFVSGWIIVTNGISVLLMVAVLLSIFEGILALRCHFIAQLSRETAKRHATQKPDAVPPPDKI